MPSYDEIRSQHTPPSPLTAGQPRSVLGRFPVDMAVRVEIPHGSGSRFAYDWFTVSGAEQPVWSPTASSTEPNQVRPVGRRSRRGACPGRGASAVSSKPGRGRRWD